MTYEIKTGVFDKGQSGKNGNFISTNLINICCLRFCKKIPKITFIFVTEALTAQRFPRDCYDILQAGNSVSGLHNIYPAYIEGPIQVFCDMDTDGGGWTVSWFTVFLC